MQTFANLCERISPRFLFGDGSLPYLKLEGASRFSAITGQPRLLPYLHSSVTEPH